MAETCGKDGSVVFKWNAHEGWRKVANPQQYFWVIQTWSSNNSY